MVLLLWVSECWNTLSVLSVCKVWSVSLDCASFFGNTLMRKLMHSNHKFGFNRTWWRHQMETFSALLAFCAGNSPVSGEFPAQRPVTRSFDVFFDLHLIKLLSKHSRGWWFETLSRPLWRHCNEQGGISVMEWSQQQPCHQWSHPHYHVWNVSLIISIMWTLVYCSNNSQCPYRNTVYYQLSTALAPNFFSRPAVKLSRPECIQEQILNFACLHVCHCLQRTLPRICCSAHFHTNHCVKKSYLTHWRAYLSGDMDDMFSVLLYLKLFCITGLCEDHFYHCIHVINLN